LPYAIDCQFLDAGKVRAVHVMPSVDVAADVEFCAIATKVALPYATANQSAAEDIVRAVHVSPGVNK
jgi:hypothetical protein